MTSINKKRNVWVSVSARLCALKYSSWSHVDDGIENMGVKTFLLNTLSALRSPPIWRGEGGGIFINGCCVRAQTKIWKRRAAVGLCVLSKNFETELNVCIISVRYTKKIRLSVSNC